MGARGLRACCASLRSRAGATGQPQHVLAKNERLPALSCSGGSEPERRPAHNQSGLARGIVPVWPRRRRRLGERRRPRGEPAGHSCPDAPQIHLRVRLDRGPKRIRAKQTLFPSHRAKESGQAPAIYGGMSSREVRRDHGGSIRCHGPHSGAADAGSIGTSQSAVASSRASIFSGDGAYVDPRFPRGLRDGGLELAADLKALGAVGAIVEFGVADDVGGASRLWGLRAFISHALL